MKVALRPMVLLVSTVGLYVGLAVQSSVIFPAPINVSTGRAKQIESRISTAQAPNLPIRALRNRARLITVKVLSGDSWGSGILIQQQGQLYTVLTNEHVLQTGNKYRIQTLDGRFHLASRYQAVSMNGNDLALLQFRSTDAVYTVARLGRSVTLAVGDQVLAAGFPFETDVSQNTGFKFTDGQVSLVTEKALDGGYQVGYTNAVEKGMSGGPVLNLQGEVVAVNGMHPYPLWGDPYVFEDGFKPCTPMHELMVKSSWAIPIETFIQLMPKSFAFTNSYSMPSLPYSSTRGIGANFDTSQQTHSSILLMRARAEAAKSCKH